MRRLAALLTVMFSVSVFAFGCGPAAPTESKSTGTPKEASPDFQKQRYEEMQKAKAAMKSGPAPQGQSAPGK